VNFVRLKLHLLIRLGILILPVAGVALGQQPAPFVVEPPPNAAYPRPQPPDYGQEGNLAAAKLRAQPPSRFVFDKASLRDVVRFLADAAQISFISIPDSGTDEKGLTIPTTSSEKGLNWSFFADRLVTFTMNASPFSALESICRDNSLVLSYQDGVWSIATPQDVYTREIVKEQKRRGALRDQRLKQEEDSKLVPVAYRLRYDPVDRVDFRADSGSSSGGSGSSSSSGSSGSSSSGGSVSTPNMPLQNSQRVFSAKAPRIINEIRVMLGLQPISYNADGSVTGGSAAAGHTVSSQVSSLGQGAVNSAQGSAAGNQTVAMGTLTDVYVPAQMPQVIYNSDTNLLWVVATREQHKWVSEYLLAVDQPQVLIAIEIKFFETTKNPSKEFGINWRGTMHPDPLTGDGGIKLTAGNITVSPSGSATLNTTGNSANARSHATTTDPAVVSPLDTLSSSSGGSKATTFSVAAPYSAILTASDVQLALQAFMSDDKTSMVQYPRVLTVNNREVAITSAENTPINTGVTQTSGGTAAQNVGALGYLPVGTQINILPKSVGVDQIAMTVAITISDILRYDLLNLGTGSNPYPVTSQRVYNAALQVNSGYTLAVGGLETTGDARFDNGIPLLQDIPGVGQFFKSKTRTRKKKNLIIFITPTIIVNPKATRGIGETPEAVVPIRPNDPTPPAFTPDGQLVGGRDAINAAFAWFDFQIKWFKQINRENRTDKETIKQLRAVISSARMLVRNIARMQGNADPVLAEEMSSHEQRAMATLTELNRILSAAQNNVM
jgi:type II secretory pathway component GspD/PulD (secretin)